MNFLRTGAILFLLTAVHAVYAQDAAGVSSGRKSKAPYVSWVSQYPAVTNFEKVNNNGLKRLFNSVVRPNQHRQFSRPVAVLANNPEDFFVLDQGAQTIYFVSDQRAEVPRCIRKKEGYFTSLVSACATPGRELLFTDSRLNKVFRINADMKKVAIVNDTMKLVQPTGVAYNAVTDEIWVVETGEHRVRILDSHGGLVKTFGGRGEEKGQFNYPTSIWIDKAGDAYIVDAMNFRVEIFNKKGEFITTFGEAGDVSGSMARPKGIATDTYGNIYVVDALFNTVQIFDRAGNLLYNFGQQGREKGEFWLPGGIYIDDKNYIYVADNYNSRIQIFHLINGG